MSTKIARLLRSVIGGLARRWPVPTYAVVGAAARATAPFAAPVGSRLHLVLPELEARELRRARLQLRSSEWNSRVLGVVMRASELEPVLPPFELSAPIPDPTRPTVFVTLHLGAIGPIGGFLQRLPRQVVALSRMEWRLPSNVVDVQVDNTEMGRVKGFYRALEIVRGGGHAVIPIDGPGIEVTLLGRRFLLTRGAFALARLTGAPLVALFARWDGGRVKIFVGDPIPAGDDERTMALAVARDFDRYLRAHPGELTDWMLAGLIDGQPPQPRE